MKNPRIACFLALSLAFVQNSSAQGFINLDFEASYVVSSHPTPYGFNTGLANVPGWTAYYAWGASNYPGGTTLIYNNETLDAANASLEGVDYWRPAIDGNYSVLLKGGTVYAGPYGVSLGQIGQIPLTARRIGYLGATGNYLQISFDGHLLSFTALGNPPGYPGSTFYTADVAGYAGQTGELLFHAVWPNAGGMIDDIAFSSIPEPGFLSFFGICALCLCWRMNWRR